MTSDLIVTLTFGRRNLNHVRDTPSHYVLSFCEVSKFHQICFNRLLAIAETRFVMDEMTDGRYDFKMPPEVPSGGVWA